MNRTQIHHIIYIVGVMTLAASLPLSHFVIGLSAFILFLNWIAEWNWAEKLARLKENREILWFAGLFCICLLGLIKTENWPVASHNILSKVPFFFSPLIVATTQPLTKKELQWVEKAFVFSTAFCCICSLIFWFTHTVTDIRYISIFIDHIRFSLCIVLSMVFCLYFIMDSKNNRHAVWGSTALILFFGCYLLVAQTLTGIIIAIILGLFYTGYAIFKMPKNRKRTSLICALAVLLIGCSSYVAVISSQYYKAQDNVIETTQTALGNTYQFDNESIVENGHHIGNYVCPEELQAAWPLRSDTIYTDMVEQTLIRYLNSKGMRKDYNAVMAMSDEDVRNVENHIANYDYTRTFGLRRALYQTFFSFSLYEKYHYINGSSFLQRLELWKASWAVIQDNWLFGVGIGDFKEALDQQLEAQHSPIAFKHNRGCHSQLLTFWLMGGIFVTLYFLFILIYPIFGMKNRVTITYVALIILILLSVLTEDTLETQTGRMLFTTFVPLLLFSENK